MWKVRRAATVVGHANTERLISLLTCFEDDDKIRLSNALKTLFPDLEISSAQTRFRNFRVAVNQAAQDLNIVLSCVVGHAQTHIGGSTLVLV